jgi:hypothetical protein
LLTGDAGVARRRYSTWSRWRRGGAGCSASWRALVQVVGWLEVCECWTAIWQTADRWVARDRVRVGRGPVTSGRYLARSSATPKG